MNSPPLQVLIVDDEAPARSRLRDVLTEIDDVAVVGEAENGQAALEACVALRPEVLLLDITMPGMSGLELAQHLQKLKRPPAIVFTTANDAHALEAFELNAVDYLMKPIRKERLIAALAKARALLPAQLDALRAPAGQRTHFSTSERGRVLLIPLAEVLYLRAELKYLTLRTREREYLLDESLSSIEQEFPQHFVRIHRNCLVARGAIRGFERQREDSGETRWLLLLDGVEETLPVSRRQQHIVREIGG